MSSLIKIDKIRLGDSGTPVIPDNRFNMSNKSLEKVDKRFIMGPIRLSWLIAASKLPGKALAISMTLWYLKGVCHSNTVRLNGKLIREFGISRPTLYRGVKALEKAGLVSISRQIGKYPIIKIIV